MWAQLFLSGIWCFILWIVINQNHIVLYTDGIYHHFLAILIPVIVPYLWHLAFFDVAYQAVLRSSALHSHKLLRYLATLSISGNSVALLIPSLSRSFSICSLFWILIWILLIKVTNHHLKWWFVTSFGVIKYTIFYISVIFNGL